MRPFWHIVAATLMSGSALTASPATARTSRLSQNEVELIADLIILTAAGTVILIRKTVETIEAEFASLDDADLRKLDQAVAEVAVSADGAPASWHSDRHPGIYGWSEPMPEVEAIGRSICRDVRSVYIVDGTTGQTSVEIARLCLHGER